MLIKDWCMRRSIACVIPLPSAIFEEKRADTNIGRLQIFADYLPFIPMIDVRKSLTFLPRFCDFLIASIDGKVNSGRYLTIEMPVLTVTQILAGICRSNMKVIRIPVLRAVMMSLAGLLWLLSGGNRIDLKLTPNRVTKLFEDTSFDDAEEIDVDEYRRWSRSPTDEILKNV